MSVDLTDPPLGWAKKLQYFFEICILILLAPFFVHQDATHTDGKIRYTTESRQPLTEILRDFFPAKPKWLPERDMPDQKGRTAIVTGGNSGIGYEICRGLLRKGAKVYMAARNHGVTQKAIAALQEEFGKGQGEIVLLACDFSDMKSVDQAIASFLRREARLDILVCNAGIVNLKLGSKTAQGYDLTLGTNVLGHHQLIRGLLPILEQTVQQNVAGEKSRVCIISSWAHNIHQPCGFDVNDPGWQKGVVMRIPFTQRTFTYGPISPGIELVKYGHSKFLNAVQAKRLHRTYGDRGIVFTAVDPGNNVTEILRNRDSITDWAWTYLAVPLLLYHPRHGALSPLWACTSAEGNRLSGQYLAPWSRIAVAARPTESVPVQDRLHAWCEQQLQKHGF